MAVCVQCGREYPSDAPRGVCDSCARKDAEQCVLTPQEQEEKNRILNHGSGIFGDVLVSTRGRVLEDQDVQRVGLGRMLAFLRGGFIGEAEQISHGFRLPEERVKEVAVQAMTFTIIEAHFLDAKQIQDRFHLSDDERRHAVRDAMCRFWVETRQDDESGPPSPENLIQIRNYFGVPFDQNVLLHAFAHGAYKDKTIVQEMMSCEQSDLSKPQLEMWNFFGDASVPEKIKRSFETSEFMYRMVSILDGYVPEHYPGGGEEMINGYSLDEDGKDKWTQELTGRGLGTFLRARMTHGLSPDEYELLYYDARSEIRKLKDENRNEEERVHLAHEIVGSDTKNLVVREKIAEWRLKKLIGEYGGIDETIVRPYLFLMNTVGGGLLLDFLNRPDSSLHDALRCDFVLQGYVHSNWSWDEDDPAPGAQDPEFSKMARDVYRDLMTQVAKDSAMYEVGSAYLEFARVLKVMEGVTIQEVVAQAKISKIPGLAGRAEKLSDPKYDPRRTWKGLKAVAGMKDLLDRLEITDTKNLSPVMSKFVAGLLESPVISSEAIADFVNRPEVFFDRGATHVDEDRQYAFSPARFAEVGRTGLTNEIVRDALVDGTLDRLQLLPPYEETYLMTDQGELVSSPEYAGVVLARALGKRSEGILGQARYTKGLFSKIQQWVVRNIPVSDKGMPLENDGAAAIIRRWVQTSEAPAVSESALLELVGQDGLLYDRHIGINQPAMYEVRVRVGAKSDPTLRASAETVANCMPFGDGKTNTFDWNPAIAQLVVERRGEDGVWRAMAQSVLMIDHEIHSQNPDGAQRNAADIIGSLREGQHVFDVLHEEDLLRPRVLVADNIEPNLNELTMGRQGIIEQAYKVFSREYLARLPENLFIDRGRMIVGKEFYETERPDWRFPVEPNRYVPGSPVSYMDSVGRDVYEIVHDGSETPKSSTSGIVDIDASHVLAMSFIEGKGFQDNRALVFGLVDRYQRILATNIAREHFNDPNFTFMVRNDRGVVKGYLLARVNHTHPDAPEVYLDDIGVDRTNGMASARYAMRLIGTFVDRYIERYATGEAPLPPIYAEMRESTSYQLVTRKLDQLAKQKNQFLFYEIVEFGESKLGGETFKRIRIILGRTQEELEKQRQTYAHISPDDVVMPEMAEEFKSTRDVPSSNDIEDNW